MKKKQKKSTLEREVLHVNPDGSIEKGTVEDLFREIGATDEDIQALRDSENDDSAPPAQKGKMHD